ncbi:MAG: glycosyltransferase family 9 protein [Candidatus Omnitrophota bacterium]|nr:glycosyltransferase family 9 protein [Candidatus Omnitrophota bacterium]
MIIDKSQVKRILVISLSNVGDIILTTPVISALAKEFPKVRIDVIVGPRGKEIFDHDPRVFKVIIYDKHMSIGEKRRLQLKLKKLHYDLVADIRNTVFPLLIGPRYRTATAQNFPRHILHSKERHLYRLRSVGIENPEEAPYIHITKDDDEAVDRLLKEEGMAGAIVVINAGAKSHLKRWPADGFIEVSDRLISECGVSIALIGLKEDEAIVGEIMGKMKNKPHNLVDKTNIRQLASLLRRSRLLITNDSAPLHLGSAVGVKIVALFGPTDPRKYGPTGEFDVVIKEKLSCAPCEKAECIRDYECMKLISPDAVFNAAKMILEGYE